MLFNSFPFLLFAVILFAALRILPERFATPVLLGASLLFYVAWYPIYLILLLGEVVASYLFALWMVRSRSPRSVLVLSIGVTLGILAWFKYSTLVADAMSPLLISFFDVEVRAPEYFLPLGISFYSFQIVAFSVDLYRGHVKELPSFGRYLLFVSFFPQLIAGPIVRGSELLPQFARGREVTSERSRRGVWLICAGLFKKVVMGDFLLAAFVDDVFASPGVDSGAVHLVAMYSFAFQIYFDFSGYTDIARGLACLLGYELPINFREPYLAVNPNEFWRRWHITLTSWFRDYVFVPLSVNRSWRAHPYVILFTTWSLVGLWHGADWHFVLWGVYHALFLMVHRLCRPLLAKVRPANDNVRRMWWLARWFVTFQIVSFGLLLFRAGSTADALTFVKSILAGSYSGGPPPFAALLVVAGLGLHVLESFIRTNTQRIRQRLGASRWGVALEGAMIGMVLALTIAASGAGAEFIYFQF